MTKIINLPTTASTDANTFVPVYKNGETYKVSATALGGGGSGLDLTSVSNVAVVDGTEYIPLNKPLGTVLRVTVQRILDWILARANTWTGVQTFNTNINITGTARRITADFSSLPWSNRTLLQTSVANSNTAIGVVPNGTSQTATLNVFSSSTPENSTQGQLAVVGGLDVRLSSNVQGTGVLLPLTFHTGGAERLRIDQTTGNVLVTSGALGYGTGTGGTVTQATSKSTPVYLNKPCGTVTMHNASLAAGASVEFSLNNNLLATGDGLIVNPDGFTGYAVEVAYFNSATDVVLRVTNKGATRSDAVTIRFRIFKGALS